MTWLEAYLLWNIGSFSTFCCLAAVGIGLYLLILWARVGILYDCMVSTDILEEVKKNVIKMTKIFCIPFILCLFLSITIPSTETLLKIIATKKGVDAVQSQTGQEFINKSINIVDNGLKLLDKSIKDKLDTKGKK